MEAIKKDSIRKEIGNFYKLNQHQPKWFTVKHFKAKGVPKSSIYDTLKRVQNNVSLERRSGSGRKVTKLTEKELRSLKRDLNKKVGQSYRSLGRKYKKHQKTMKNIINSLGYVRKNQIRAPKVSSKQKIIQRKRLNKVRKNSLRPRNGLEVIMDDESYYPFDNPYTNHYYVKKGKEAPNDKKYKTKEKYGKKLLVWLAISSKGRSVPYFHFSREAINQKNYQNECITQRLVPFIEKYHQNKKIIFWPDLATAHYAKDTISLLKTLGISFVPKNENPPNCPQLRPIEDFWAEHKRRVYENGWSASSSEQLIKRINLKLKTFGPDYWSNLMSKVKTNVRLAADKGLNLLIH